jgi:hypothetical protein
VRANTVSFVRLDRRLVEEACLSKVITVREVDGIPLTGVAQADLK